MHGWRTMGKHSEVFVAFDVAKKKHAVAIAEAGRTGEVRFLGDVENAPLPIERTIKRLADRYDRLRVCFEAGPTGYGPRLHGGRSGPDPEALRERIKTNRRDAVTLARLYRAGELTGVRDGDDLVSVFVDAACWPRTSSASVACKSKAKRGFGTLNSSIRGSRIISEENHPTAEFAGL